MNTLARIEFYSPGGGIYYGHCLTETEPQGTPVHCALDGDFPDGAEVHWRAKGWNGNFWGGGSLAAAAGWSPWTSTIIAASPPAPPQISCGSTYVNESWHETAPPGQVTCTITAAGSGANAADSIWWSRDGGPWTQTSITPSSNPAVAQTTVMLPNTLGAHSIVAVAESRVGHQSDANTHGVGFGPFSIVTPAPVVSGAASLTTSGRMALKAQGPKGAASSFVRWRVAGLSGSENPWIRAEAPRLKVTTAGEIATVAGYVDLGTFSGMEKKRSKLIQLQVCLQYPGASGCSSASAPITVLKVPHAFGPANPVADAGAGAVSMLTGEFMTTETDVNEPGFNSRLTISRTHSTFGGPDGGQGVFGPGWTDSIDGPGAGMAGSYLFDGTLDDGTIAAVDSEGNVLVWAASLPVARRTSDNLTNNSWVPVDDTTRLSGIKLSVSGVGASTQVTITEVDGTRTVFKVTAAPTAGQPYEFVPSHVEEVGQTGRTTYVSNSAGLITMIHAPTPPGVSCTGIFNPGCRSLHLTYNTVAGGPRLRTVHWTNGLHYRLVASYAYDESGRLTSATDQANLTTTYSYDPVSTVTDPRLAAITPPGLKAFRLSYDSERRLDEVERDNAAGAGTTRLATIRYEIPIDGGEGADLPDVSAGAVSAWNQQTLATQGAAFFGSTAPAVPSDVAEIDADDWKWASLYFADDDGRTTNAAEFGAGRWLLTAADYDDKDNIVRSLSARDIANIRDGKVAAAHAGALFKYDAIKNSAGAVTVPAGSLLTESFGPARDAVINTDGTREFVRPHTRYVYDEWAPNDGINLATNTGYGLLTTTITRPWDVATEADVSAAGTIETEVRTGYDPVGGSASGWALGLPITSTTEMGPGQTDIVSTTQYDGDGRVVATRQPKSNGADAGTRKTTYYTAGANAADGRCGNKVHWAGAVCLIKYAGSAADGPLPETFYASYDNDLNPLTVEEAIPAGTRRTTNYRYNAGRLSKQWTTTNGVPGSTFAKGQETTYAATTGLPTAIRSLDQTGTAVGDPISTGYDAWGRVVTYTPAPGEETATNYDDKGRIGSVVDPRGTTTYRYDGATSSGDGNDADGNTERRGYLTSVSTTRPGESDVVFTGAYDEAGALVTQTMPGELTQRTGVNTVGELTSMSYSGQVHTPDGNDGTTTDPDGVWLGWSQERDYLGRVAHEWTPDGAGFIGDLEEGAAAGYTRAYAYDPAGRLTNVVDHAAPIGGGTVEHPTETSPGPSGTECETRTYSFDLNGNRTGLSRRGANSDGTCASGIASARIWAYDHADRFSSGYSYDVLGRVTTMPAADTPAGATVGAIGLAYYDTDVIRSIVQDSLVSTYTLDAVGRRMVEAEGPIGGPTVTSVTSHFTGSSDNPAWVVKEASAGTSTSRYIDSLGGDLTATLTSEGTSVTADADLVVALTNPHGDIVTTVPVLSSGPATEVESWSSYDEYGNVPLGAVGNGPLDQVTGTGYGWVGGKQRAVQGAGLILMGARVYNPATASFTSVDPIFGGNSTDYTYPQDPVNRYDLSGQCSWCKKVKNGVKKAAGSTVSFLSGRDYIDGGLQALTGDVGMGANTASGGLASSFFGVGAKNANGRWGSYGKRSKRSAGVTVLKTVVKTAARVVATPVAVAATVVDYAVNGGPKLPKRGIPAAPASMNHKRKDPIFA